MKSKDPNIAKEAFKSKQIKMGSQIRGAILFEAFSYFKQKKEMRALFSELVS